MGAASTPAATRSQPDPPTRADVLAELGEAFEEAARAGGGPVEHRRTIAGSSVCIRFASPTSESLLGAAFAHLAKDERTPVLTIRVWDSTSPRARRPSFVPIADCTVAQEDAARPGASYFYRTAEFHALHQPGPDVVSVLAAEGADAWFWMPDVSRLPHWDYAAPFRHVFSWWLSAQGFQFVHAGAVGRPGGGLLLVGQGGSGKSTVALASLLDPRLRYAGDDYVALAGGPSPSVHSLYCSGKLNPPDLGRVAHVRSAVANPDGLDHEKAVVYVPRAFPHSAISGFPLKAIVMPRVTGGSPRMLETSHAAALAALAPSTVLQRRPPQPELLPAMARLVEQVPAFVLEVGPEIAAVPGTILELLESLPEREAP